MSLFGAGVGPLGSVPLGGGLPPIKIPQVSDPTGLTSIFPSFGPIAGGTLVTLGGTGFVAGQTVAVGGVACTSVVAVSSTVMTAVTAAGSAGTGTVTVRGAGAGITGLVWGYRAGLIARWIGAQAPASGGFMTAASWVDDIGGLTISVVTSGAYPAVTAAAINGHAGVRTDGATHYLRNTTLAHVQPLQCWLVAKQISWTSFGYVIGGGTTNPVVLEQPGTGFSGVSPDLCVYAGVGPSAPYNTQLSLQQYAIVETGWNGASSFITVDIGSRGTAVTANAGSNNLTNGFALGAFTDGSGKTSIEYALVLWIDPTLADLPSLYADVQRDFQCGVDTLISAGDSITKGYALSDPTTQSWPAQAGTYLGSYLIPWGEDEATSGDPISGPSPFTGTTIIGLLSTNEYVAMAAAVGQNRVVVDMAGGSNDIAIGASAATIKTRFQTYFADLRAEWTTLGGDPTKIHYVINTIIARTWLSDVYGTAASKLAVWTALNADILANPTAYGADVADDSASLSVFSDPTNSTYYGNPDSGSNYGVHPTAAADAVWGAHKATFYTAQGWAPLA